MKVGKEEIVGLVTALELYLQRDPDEEFRAWARMGEHIMERLSGLEHVTCWQEPTDRVGRPVPQTYVKWDEQSLPISTDELIAQLKAGDPSIHVKRQREIINIDPHMMVPGDEELVADRLLELLSGSMT